MNEIHGKIASQVLQIGLPITQLHLRAVTARSKLEEQSSIMVVYVPRPFLTDAGNVNLRLDRVFRLHKLH